MDPHPALSRCLPLLVTLAACPGSSSGALDGSTEAVTVTGRVVDFETCLSAAGCQGVAEMRVSLLFDPARASDKTRPDGAFTIRVPNGVRSYLLCVDGSGSERFLPTLQAAPVTTQGAAVANIEIYALQKQGGLYAAIAAETQMRFDARGLYLGQVLSLRDGAFKALAGASVAVHPKTTVRYVRDNPRFNKGELALFGTGQAATGPFGQFVFVAGASTQDYAITVEVAGANVTPHLAPIGAGYVTIGLHRAAARSDAGVTSDARPSDARPADARRDGTRDKL